MQTGAFVPAVSAFAHLSASGGKSAMQTAGQPTTIPKAYGRSLSETSEPGTP
jgi:hypothetical protein